VGEAMIEGDETAGEEVVLFSAIIAKGKKGVKDLRRRERN